MSTLTSLKSLIRGHSYALGDCLSSIAPKTHKLLSISRNDIQCSYCSRNKPPESGAFTSKLLEMAKCERRKHVFHCILSLTGHTVIAQLCFIDIFKSYHFSFVPIHNANMASAMTEAKTGGNNSSWSSPFFTLWFTKANYTSALLHERTANFRSYWDEIIHGWENLGSHESFLL